MNDPNAPGPWIWDHAPDYHLTTTEESEKPDDTAEDVAQQKNKAKRRRLSTSPKRNHQ